MADFIHPFILPEYTNEYSNNTHIIFLITYRFENHK